MAERDDLKEDAERSSDKIRRDIVAKRETISETVDRLGERIQEKLDWREYVAEYPYWAIGVAAGVGLVVSTVVRRRSTPLDRISDALTDTIEELGGHVRHAVGGALMKAGGRGLVKGTLYGMATKMAVDWLKGAASNALSADNYDEPARPTRSATQAWASNPEPSSSRPV